MSTADPDSKVVTDVLQFGLKMFFQGFVTGRTPSILAILGTTKQETSNSSNVVTVKRDAEKEYIEIDYKNMENGKFYLVNYKNELHAIKKISDDAIATFDVVT